MSKTQPSVEGATVYPKILAASREILKQVGVFSTAVQYARETVLFLLTPRARTRSSHAHVKCVVNAPAKNTLIPHRATFIVIPFKPNVILVCRSKQTA